MSVKHLKKALKLLAIAALFLVTVPYSLVEACTGFIIGKDLAKDGYTIFGRTEDLEEHHNKNFVITPAQKYNEGDVLYDRSVNQSYAHAAEEYAYYSFMDRDRHSMWGIYGEHGFNEHGVAITATVSAYANDQILAVDPWTDNGVTEAIMTTLVLPRVKTAREGIEFLAETLDRVGSAEGNILVIADANETWYMEILSGHQYAAIKFPDDKFAVFPNSFYLGTIDDFADSDKIVSEGLVSTAKEAGSYKEVDGKFHIARSYAAGYSEGDRSRTYAAIKYLDPSANINYEDEIFELLHTPTDPNKKYTVEDMRGFQRDRFENLDKDFIPDDLMFAKDKELYDLVTEIKQLNRKARYGTITEEEKVRLAELKEKFATEDMQTRYNQFKYPLGNKNVMEAHIYEMRQDLPKEFGGVLWVAMDASRNNAYIPFYGNMTDTHESFQPLSIQYDPDSFYWVADNIDNMASTFPDLFGNTIQEKWEAYEKEAAAELAKQNEYYLNAKLDPERAAYEVTKDAWHRVDHLFQQMKSIEKTMELKIEEAGYEYTPFQNDSEEPAFENVEAEEMEVSREEIQPEEGEVVEGTKYAVKYTIKHGIEYQVNPNKPVGHDKIVQEGVDGSGEKVVRVYTDAEGKEQEEVLSTTEEVATQPRIVEIGTGKINTQTIPSYKSVPFETEYVETDELEVGQEELVQEGKTGMRVKAVRHYFLNGEDYSQQVTFDGITTEPVNRIIKVGTKVVEEPSEPEQPEDNKPGNTEGSNETDNQNKPGNIQKEDPKDSESKADNKATGTSQKTLPKTGMVVMDSMLASGLLLTGLGLAFVDRKRK